MRSTLVLGASLKANRYSHLAVERLVEKGIETNTKVPFDARSREALPDAYAFLNHWVSNLYGFVDLLERLELLNTDLVNQINSNYSE